MKRLYLFPVFFCTCMLAAAQTSISNEVKEADSKLNALIREHNTVKAAAFYSDNFILTTSSGAFKLKQDMLNEIGLADLLLEINETSEVTVRSVENTAVLTGILHQKGSFKGKVVDVKLNVTDTWVKTTAGWKLLAGHASVITTK
jgi:ketosteroid isomerase-like protein